MEININELTFDDQGLIPAIIQDSATGKVLTLAYMNKESLQKTIETKETWFYSRKRNVLWNKGETSGNKQIVQAISMDCDQDALLVQVQPLGPACHTNHDTCFYQPLIQDEKQGETFTIIEKIVDTIQDRKENPVDGSYTTYLFNEGIDKVLKKIGEEASEVIIASKNPDQEELIWEIADLVYHTLVVMNMRDITVSDIKAKLMQRHLTPQK